MAKKSNLTNPLLIDKIEKYLSNNYIFILSTIAILIIIIFSLQIINNFLDRKNKNIYNKLGFYEVSVNKGSFTVEDTNKFISIGTKYSSIRDYVHLKSAILYTNMKNTDKAIPLLENNKKFEELSKSLLFDLGNNVDMKKYQSEGYLKSLWAYRNILADNKITDTEINSFKKEYENSQLLPLLENWQE